jgi:hypothetical protein
MQAAPQQMAALPFMQSCSMVATAVNSTTAATLFKAGTTAAATAADHTAAAAAADISVAHACAVLAALLIIAASVLYGANLVITQCVALTTLTL